MKIRDRIRAFKRVPSSALIGHPENWRKHPPEQKAALEGVLKEIGYADALLVRPLARGKYQIIDGHLRASTTPNQRVPVLVLDVNEDEARKMLATVDPLAALADTDGEALRTLLAKVTAEEPALKAMLKRLADESPVVPKDGLTDPDDVPEAPAKPVTKRGDLWLLGDHRLLCGDSTKAEDVKRVMDGAEATLMFTDPPYGVGIGKKNAMLNTFQKAGRCLDDLNMDDMSPDELGKMLLTVFSLWRGHLSDECSVFVCSPQGGELCMMMMMMKEAGLEVRHILNWIKNSPTFSMGRLDYDYQNEPILFTWTKTHKRKKDGTFQTSLWTVDKPMANKEHPTMKPVALPECAMLNHSDAGDVCVDPFLGSGTTLIAAEKLGRRCYAMEIESRYVDVAVKRWEKFTGKKATLDRPKSRE